MIALLNAILPEGRRIADLEFRDPGWVGKTDLDRRAFFDLYCYGTDGTRFIVELQRARQRFFIDRCLWYSTFAIQEQAIRGPEWDFRLAPVIAVAILDFTLDGRSAVPTPGTLGAETGAIHIVHLKDQYNRVFTDKYMQVYVELPRFLKTEHSLSSERDKWLYFLRNAGNLTARPAGLTGKMFDDLFEEAKVALLPPEEREEYEGELRKSRDLMNAFRTAKEDGHAEGHEQGRAEGHEEGRAEGREEGRAEGREEGRVEGLAEGHTAGHAEGRSKGVREKAEQVATDTLREGLGLAIAVKLSKLSEDEVRALAKREGIEL